jgi:hypothetical protein
MSARLGVSTSPGFYTCPDPPRWFLGSAHLNEQAVLRPVQLARGRDGLRVDLALVAHGHLHSPKKSL